MLGVTGLHFDQLQQKTEKNINGWDFGFRYIFWVFNWIAGHILGGIALFGFTGLIGSIFSPVFNSYCLVILGLICFAGALGQFKIIRFPMPQLHRQVPRIWLSRLHRNIIALGYGFQLGSAVATRIKVITTYVVIGCALCSGSLITGAVIGIVFGISRATLPIALAPLATVPDKSLDFALRFSSYDWQVQKTNGIALLLAGAALSFSVVINQIGQ